MLFGGRATWRRRPGYRLPAASLGFAAGLRAATERESERERERDREREKERERETETETETETERERERASKMFSPCFLSCDATEILCASGRMCLLRSFSADPCAGLRSAAAQATGCLYA